MPAVDAQKPGAILPLLSSPLVSSGELGWKGLLLERHSISPSECPTTDVRHHVVEFMYGAHPLKGERRDTSGKFKPFPRRPEAISLFFDGVHHAVRSFARVEVILAGLDRQFVKEVIAELDSDSREHLYEQLNISDEVSGSLLRLLEIEARSREQANTLYVDHLVYALTLRLLSLRTRGPNRDIPKGALPPQKLRRVIDRMKADLTEDLDLRTLAAESGYSRSHFLRLFRAATDCTPHRYFLRLRTEKAQSLMKNKFLRMIDIAEACGFTDQTQLSRVFRQIHGVTPSEYRRDLL
jgi:AraC family transcriptional regulator